MLAVPTLTVADNGDGTGATATIAGSDPASTNTLLAQQVTGTGGQSWTTYGSRTADGTLALAVSTGIWWFQCLSTTATQASVANFVQQAITDGSLAVHESCLQAVESALITLAQAGSFPGILAAQVYRQFAFDPKGLTLPALVVLPGIGAAETLNAGAFVGTNQQDDVGYPCDVVPVDRIAGDYAPARPGWLLIRQRLFRRFRNQRILGASNLICLAEPKQIVDVRALQYQVLASPITLRFVNREVRGIV